MDSPTAVGSPVLEATLRLFHSGMYMHESRHTVFPPRFLPIGGIMSRAYRP